MSKRTSSTEAMPPSEDAGQSEVDGIANTVLPRMQIGSSVPPPTTDQIPGMAMAGGASKKVPGGWDEDLERHTDSRGVALDMSEMNNPDMMEDRNRQTLDRIGKSTHGIKERMMDLSESFSDKNTIHFDMMDTYTAAMKTAHELPQNSSDSVITLWKDRIEGIFADLGRSKQELISMGKEMDQLRKDYSRVARQYVPFLTDGNGFGDRFQFSSSRVRHLNRKLAQGAGITTKIMADPETKENIRQMRQVYDRISTAIDDAMDVEASEDASAHE